MFSTPMPSSSTESSRCPFSRRARKATEPPSGRWARPWRTAFSTTLETLDFSSRILFRDRDLLAYVPAGFEAGSASLPVVYVTGGEFWFDAGELKPALDTLMAGSCPPAIVVGLPFHVGSADRMGGFDYAQSILQEVAPLIRERYGPPIAELAFGASDDATGILALAGLAPERFRRVAVLSPAADPEDFALLERAEETPEAVWIEWSTWELHLRDENTDYRESAERLVEHFRGRNVEVQAREVPQGPGFTSWRARLGDVLAFLLEG